MLLIEREYKKICIWKDELPFICKGDKTTCLHKMAGDTSWYNGTIAIEARLGVRHISNYAMIFMEYIHKQQNSTDIIIRYGNESKLFNSQVLPFNKNVYMGLDEEFADAIVEFFEKYPIEKFPNGTIKILGGGYNEIGSSNSSFQKVMELLVFIFQYIDVLTSDQLQQELLNLI